MKIRNRKTYHPILRISILLIVFLIIIITLLDLQIRPLVKSVAANQAQVSATKIINECVQEKLMRMGVNYSGLVNIERDDTGKILAITTDISRSNVLKASISSDIQDKLSGTEPNLISIPMGTLTGVELLNGRGPMIEMKLCLPSSVCTEFESNFTSAGINQTKHQIYMHINTKVNALIPGYPTSTTVDTNILVAETIIVGEVPNVFANLDSSNAGTIADFSRVD